MHGYESVIKDKNEKIQDMSSKLEETEINLEEALQNISASKGQDKEKKELQKLVKQLQASLRDYETRQFANAKLIVLLASKTNELANVKDRLDDSSAKIHQLEKEIRTPTMQLEPDDQDQLVTTLTKSQLIHHWLMSPHNTMKRKMILLVEFA